VIDFIKTYVKYILLHKWNKISKEGIDLLDEYWENKPTKGIKLWLYNKVKYKNVVE
jgi:hypothetical protein